MEQWLIQRGAGANPSWHWARGRVHLQWCSVSPYTNHYNWENDRLEILTVVDEQTAHCAISHFLTVLNYVSCCCIPPFKVALSGPRGYIYSSKQVKYLLIYYPVNHCSLLSQKNIILWRTDVSQKTFFSVGKLIGSTSPLWSFFIQLLWIHWRCLMSKYSLQDYRIVFFFTTAIKHLPSSSCLWCLNYLLNFNQPPARGASGTCSLACGLFYNKLRHAQSK